MMEVILLERIENLGQMGDVVRVRPGFARNYLLPKRKALRATKDNMARFESQRAQLEAQNLNRRQEAEAVGGKLDGLKVVLLRQASEAGQLYGSVTARDIAEAVTEAGFTILKSQVVLNQPIKELGLHTIRVVLHPEVSVSVVANVAKSAEEAEAQVTGVSAERQEAEQAFAEATGTP
jgi:large subunit ribosomal protein L9